MWIDGISPPGRFHAAWCSAQLSGTGETVRLVPRKRLNGSLRRPSCKPSPIDADQTHSLWGKGGCGLALGIRRGMNAERVPFRGFFLAGRAKGIPRDSEGIL
jgi:hypothetical protein